MREIKSYRQIRVLVTVGKYQSYVTVAATTVSGGHRVDRLLHRAAIPHVDAGTVAAALRVIGDECHDAADAML